MVVNNSITNKVRRLVGVIPINAYTKFDLANLSNDDIWIGLDMTLTGLTNSYTKSISDNTYQSIITYKVI